jgi:hypothetical protein
MGAAQSRVRGIQHLHTAALSSKTIATELKYSSTTIAEALYSTDSESPPVKRDLEKTITSEISPYIEILSLMDSLLTNDRKTSLKLKSVKLSVALVWSNDEIQFKLLLKACFLSAVRMDSQKSFQLLSKRHRIFDISLHFALFCGLTVVVYSLFGFLSLLTSFHAVQDLVGYIQTFFGVLFCNSSFLRVLTENSKISDHLWQITQELSKNFL